VRCKERQGTVGAGEPTALEIRWRNSLILNYGEVPMKFYCIIIPLVIIIFLGVATEYCKSQPGLSAELKANVYRIVSMEDSLIFEGTGMMLSQGSNYFLITNRHVISDQNGIVRDSVFIFLNNKTSNFDVISGPQRRRVLLEKGDTLWYYLPSLMSLDLALIGIGPSNVDFRGIDSVFSLKTDIIPDIGRIRAYLDSTTILTAIGYPGKDQILSVRTPEYLWGYFEGFDDIFIKSNIPILHGNSGSPLIARYLGQYRFVGIIFMRYNSAYAIPANYIYTCFDEYFRMISKK